MSMETQHAQKLKEYQDVLEHFFKSYFQDSQTTAELKQAMEYALLDGGKRIRPVLTLAFCELFGGSVHSALPFALAVEMIHSYSLIHDDLPCMDDDDLRRGKPSCHKQFGEATAILAGDALLTSAFYALATAKLPPEIILEGLAHLSVSAGEHGMVGGQAMELSFTGTPPNINELVQIQQLKTGALLSSACFLGALAGGACEEDGEKILQFAGFLGGAFQIRDDILDAVGSESELGKPIGSDEKSGKETFYTVFGAEVAQERLVDLTKKAKSQLDSYRNNEFILWLADELTQRKK